MKVLPIQNMPPTTRLEGESKRFCDDLKVSIDANNLEIRKRLTDIGSTITTIDNSITTIIDNVMGKTRRAKIQTSGVGTDTFTCKLLNTTGTETGDNITVYTTLHLGTNDLNAGNVWPSLSDGDIIPVFLDLDNKYYTTFVFDDIIDCSV